MKTVNSCNSLFVEICNRKDGAGLTKEEIVSVKRSQYDSMTRRLSGDSFSITPTEQLVCLGLFLNLTSKEIARTRGVSFRTIETHISNLKMKIGAKRLGAAQLNFILDHIEKA